MMNSTPEQNKNRGARVKVVIVWLAILLLISFWLTVRGSTEPVSMMVIPQVPREGEPVIAIFTLDNPSPEALVARYQLYADGELLKEGTATIVPGSGKTYKYAYENPIPLGESINFLVRTQSRLGDYEKPLSSPPYPPQVWSSFVSFASFSTSVMSSISTMTYYQSTFGSYMGLNIGVIYTIVLITLLIFLEMVQALQERTTTILGRLRLRFNTVTWILFIIFMATVYTKVVMIITT